MIGEDEIKRRIISLLQKQSPTDLSIKDIAAAIGVGRNTASKYLAILEAQGKIRMTRRMDRAKLYAMPSEFSHEIQSKEEISTPTAKKRTRQLALLT
jgi:DNA-binding Lrp family transcriptional regulator